MTPEAVVFIGPSLSREALEGLPPEIVLRGPIRRGDLQALSGNPPRVIGIVDGEFYQSLAISPKEILPFLERGVRVLGSSSMGALRAAELHSYGMQGVGTIFDWYRRGRLEADDEVAMAFCPSTLRALSEPLVNFRVALRVAQKDKLLIAAERVELTRRMRRRYFPERTALAFFRDLDAVVPEERRAAVRDWWMRSAPNTKADDARDLLRAVVYALGRNGFRSGS